MLLKVFFGRTLARHNVIEPKFKGFMVDSAQANWNAIQKKTTSSIGQSNWIAPLPSSIPITNLTFNIFAHFLA
jgi:hypothetical protein